MAVGQTGARPPTVHGESLESPGLCSLDGLVPARPPCTYKVRSELLLRRERCHHHTVRVCDAALLVRFNPVWCTLASSVHQAASTRPVRERWRGHVECSPRGQDGASVLLREVVFEKPDPTGMISSTFQPWPILSSLGPPLTCHVPDLFSRASEFLHNYCVRWALGGSHGVAPA